MARKQAGDAKSASTKATSAPAAAHPAAQDGQTPRYRQESSNFLSVRLLLVMLVVPLVAMVWQDEAPKRPFALAHVQAKDGTLKNELITPRVLLVTAHPDDEVLFAPTILALLDDEHKLHAPLWTVALSMGDFGGGLGLGEARRVEWARSWNVLGLERDKREILDESKLKDDNVTAWEPAAVAEHLESIVLKHDIDTILTFDERGVTTHPQHTSIPKGVKHLLASPSFKSKYNSKKPRKAALRLFTLRTYASTQQYGVFSPIVEHVKLGVNAIFSDFGPVQDMKVKVPNTIFISSVKRYVRALRALLQHKSQLSPSLIATALWGRYFWVNEWVEVSTS